MMYTGMGFDAMFTIVPVIVCIGFVLVFGMMIVSAVKGISQWNKNNASPKLTVEAELVAKRGHVSRHHHSGGPDRAGHTTTSTTYYVTFQVPSGDRMEFQVPDREYGLLVEGDKGKLTFQGTRYQGFERMR